MTDLCEVKSRAGEPCTGAPGSRGLCHMHDPDGAYALQHPANRAALLARSDIRAVLRRHGVELEADGDVLF